MKTVGIASAVVFTLEFLSSFTEAQHDGSQLSPIARRHQHRHRSNLGKRDGQCAFPGNDGLVSVTPGSSNAGWAMSPDQQCTPNSWCPYACPSGQLSMQWDPNATTYSYPQSQYGGLHCDSDGSISKPFSDKPYCQNGTGAVTAKNNAGGNVAFCQTVLPGNEAMLIPTDVTSETTLAVPDQTYWAGTSAHYYINPPGVSTDDGCVWGSTANPYGNWAPYVAGANTDSNGITYVKLGWNPIYLEQTTPFRNDKPKFTAEIQCDGDGCDGLPCAIDLDNGVNACKGPGCNTGAGGANACTVAAHKGVKAHIVINSA
ncbi:glycoside hydrolase family 132 protein [Xylona heveae TC161]|uniref:Glycoside hydrolase family 132 protein n=1 Tax=Xylona heveae (strain CBS 132557 / TC161) TaxID=1328760 RepID=A0A161TGA3_XYLHT|nr:glycoside hydrolase family 132 protein [Xylona heveae TC161]KZF25167.1 glycoside hydrolase family 132 protein [Xylona heveae TC161]